MKAVVIVRRVRRRRLLSWLLAFGPKTISSEKSNQDGGAARIQINIRIYADIW